MNQSGVFLGSISGIYACFRSIIRKPQESLGFFDKIKTATV